MQNSNSPIDTEETSIGTHALLLTPAGNIILQRRMTDPRIPNPGKIGMFGGALKRSEDPEMGLQRELLEELELVVEKSSLEKLGIYYKTKELDGINFTVYVYVIRGVEIEKLKLHEGAGFLEKPAEELTQNPLITRITRLALEDLKKKLA